MMKMKWAAMNWDGGRVEEDDVQEELDLDADDDRDGLINKSEDLLDDDYRNN